MKHVLPFCAAIIIALLACGLHVLERSKMVMTPKTGFLKVSLPNPSLLNPTKSNTTLYHKTQTCKISNMDLVINFDLFILYFKSTHSLYLECIIHYQTDSETFWSSQNQHHIILTHDDSVILPYESAITDPKMLREDVTYKGKKFTLNYFVRDVKITPDKSLEFIWGFEDMTDYKK